MRSLVEATVFLRAVADLGRYGSRSIPNVEGVRSIIGGGRVRIAGLPVISGSALLNNTCECCRCAPSDFACPRGSYVQPMQGFDSSRRAGHHAVSLQTSWWTLWWRHNGRDGVSNHQPHRGPVNSPHKWPVTRKIYYHLMTSSKIRNEKCQILRWMLLHFTSVIQQNCHQPRRKFKTLLCTIDRLSSQVVKIRNQPIHKLSCFWYRKLYALLFIHGG